ncbi:MAG: glycosyltransferase [Bacteroidales bacterium]|jgi:glycosyltransferase involved in cell wall biosynthesis|nr:glycosyltransferase [Bacteroidales bacterium]
MRNLRVGIWTQNIAATFGGGPGYYAELVECISKSSFSNAEICFIGEDKPESIQIGNYRYYSVRNIRTKKFLFLKIIGSILSKIFHINILSKIYYETSHNHMLKQYDQLLNICDIIYYPTPACKYPDFPFICTLWDLGHINSFAFPEVTSYGNFEKKKNHNEVTLFKALMVICESEAGKKEAIDYLKINKERIRILPLFPTKVISENLTPIKPEKIDEKCVFIHYPAQFWAHKNHYNLILAFMGVLENYPDIKLILTGSDQGNKTYIKETINKLNLSNSIIDLGFITLSELKWLYLHSKGLVMPTLIGPTNMPPLEALALGCPVAITDLPGHREQLGDNAIYFNPLDTKDIGNAIQLLIDNKTERKPLKVPTVEANMKLLDNFFGELKSIRQLWK